jgi:hypothetical protein
MAMTDHSLAEALRAQSRVLRAHSRLLRLQARAIRANSDPLRERVLVFPLAPGVRELDGEHEPASAAVLIQET